MNRSLPRIIERITSTTIFNKTIRDVYIIAKFDRMKLNRISFFLSFFFETQVLVNIARAKDECSCNIVILSLVRDEEEGKSALMSEIKRTYEISPKGAKASLKVCVSISGLRSPTNMW